MSNTFRGCWQAQADAGRRMSGEAATSISIPCGGTLADIPSLPMKPIASRLSWLATRSMKGVICIWNLLGWAVATRMSLLVGIASAFSNPLGWPLCCVLISVWRGSVGPGLSLRIAGNPRNLSIIAAN